MYQHIASVQADPVIHSELDAYAETLAARSKRVSLLAEDYKQSGNLAILKARKTFKRGAGSTWRSWALTKAKFSMLDARRQASFTKRSQQARQVLVINETDLVPGLNLDIKASMPRLDHLDLWAWVRSHLSCRAYIMLARRFRDGWEFKRIGKAYGVCESRANQIVLASIETLRAKGWSYEG